LISVWDATLDMKYQRIALKKIGSYVGNGFKIKGIPFLIRIAIRLGFIPIRMLAWGISFAYVIGYIFKNCCSRHRPIEQFFAMQFVERHSWGWCDYVEEQSNARMTTEFEEIRNFRTMAGYDCSGFPHKIDKRFTEQGFKPTTKNGVFYRCARPELSTVEDLRKLKYDLKIKTILDLRGWTRSRLKFGMTSVLDAEYPWDWDNAEFPKDYIGQPRRVPVRMVNGQVMKQMVKEAFKVKGKKHVLPLALITLWFMARVLEIVQRLAELGLRGTFIFDYFFLFYVEIGEWMMTMLMGLSEAGRMAQLPTYYRAMLQHSQFGIRQAMEIVAESKNHPVLIHCEHGKDRTGIICALTLACVGVHKSEIYHDFHLSENFTRTTEYARESENKMMPPHLIGPRGYSPFSCLATFHRNVLHPPSYMELTFEWFATFQKGKFEDMEEYLDHIGIFEDDRERIRRSFVDVRGTTTRLVPKKYADDPEGKKKSGKHAAVSLNYSYRARRISNSNTPEVFNVKMPGSFPEEGEGEGEGVGETPTYSPYTAGVNGVSPGPFDTEIAKREAQEAAKAAAAGAAAGAPPLPPGK